METHGGAGEQSLKKQISCRCTELLLGVGGDGVVVWPLGGFR